MRVNDSNLNAVTIGTRQPGRADAVQADRSNGYAHGWQGGQDRVSLSDLTNAVSQAADDDPGRSERVERLAATYESGSYRVEARALSASIVDDSVTAN